MRTDLATCLARYFGQYLLQQRRLSRHTIHSYRDCWKLLLRYASAFRHKGIEELAVADFEGEVVERFLESLSSERSNLSSTRNVRLAAIKSFFRWLAGTEPSYLGICGSVLQIPAAKERREEVVSMEREELDAVLSSINVGTAIGQRNYTLLSFMYNTAARVQETLNVRIRDLQMQRPYTVRLLGKGDRERFCVLWPSTMTWIRRLIGDLGAGSNPEAFLFQNRLGEQMTRHGVRYVLRRAARAAHGTCTTLMSKPLHPHVLRHTAAMHMLQSGVDLASIQNILGHQSPETTSRYARANLAMKRAALEKCEPLTRTTKAAWKSDPSLLAFLDGL